MTNSNSAYFHSKKMPVAILRKSFDKAHNYADTNGRAFAILRAAFIAPFF
jgi:hypothetical protein